jgi:hypothetical protein
VNHTIKPARRNPAVCASDAADRRRQRNVAVVHQLGVRALYELLREIDAIAGTRTTIDRVVARYASLDPEMVRLFGADQFPPHPDLRIAGGRHG